MKYNWTKEEQSKLPLKRYTYGTAFSGAGGASMGLHYLNRFQGIFFNEIDEKQIKMYKANLHSMYGFEMPIQELVKESLEDKPECFDLDILQTSPPCSLYSISNLTADEKKGVPTTSIKESSGVCQAIDELYQPAIELCGKLQPKVFIIENVVGLTYKKNAPYVDDIYKRLSDIEYSTQHFIINGDKIGLPQKRNRVFFVAIRSDLSWNGFNLDFNEPKVIISDIKYTDSDDRPQPPKRAEVLKGYQYGDRDCGVINSREWDKSSLFSVKLPIEDRDTFNTLTTKNDANIIVRKKLDGYDFLRPTPQQLIQAQSFPLDYDFLGKSVMYPLGMSVAPLMMAKLVERIEEHILSPFYKGDI